MLSSYINQSFENLLINGADGISQRNGQAFNLSTLNTTNAGLYGFDRFHHGGGSVFATGNLSLSDPIGGPGISLSNRPQGRIQRYEVTAIEATPAITQVKTIDQKIEGTTLKAFQAIRKDLFASFWMNATPGLTLTLSLQSNNEALTNVVSYLIPIVAVSGWTRYAFSIPKQLIQDVHTGTGNGLSFNLSFHTGSNFESPNANVWQSGNFLKLPGESNFMDTIGNFIELDQLQLLSGERFSTDFVNNAEWVSHSKRAGGELSAMQRYYEKSYDIDTPPGTITFNGAELFRGTSAITSSFATVMFKIRKRVAAATNTIYSTNVFNVSGVWSRSGSTDVPIVVSQQGEHNMNSSTVGFFGGEFLYTFNWTSEAEL